MANIWWKKFNVVLHPKKECNIFKNNQANFATIFLEKLRKEILNIRWVLFCKLSSCSDSTQQCLTKAVFVLTRRSCLVKAKTPPNKIQKNITPIHKDNRGACLEMHFLCLKWGVSQFQSRGSNVSNERWWTILSMLKHSLSGKLRLVKCPLTVKTQNNTFYNAKLVVIEPHNIFAFILKISHKVFEWGKFFDWSHQAVLSTSCLFAHLEHEINVLLRPRWEDFASKWRYGGWYPSQSPTPRWSALAMQRKHALFGGGLEHPETRKLQGRRTHSLPPHQAGHARGCRRRGWCTCCCRCARARCPRWVILEVLWNGVEDEAGALAAADVRERDAHIEWSLKCGAWRPWQEPRLLCWKLNQPPDACAQWQFRKIWAMKLDAHRLCHRVAATQVLEELCKAGCLTSSTCHTGLTHMSCTADPTSSSPWTCWIYRS